MTTSPSLQQGLPSHYRNKQAFLSSLPPWRRLLAKLNWHPTVELKVKQYALEQKEIEREQRLKRLDEVEQKLNALWPSSNSSTTQPQPPANDSGTSSL